VSSLYTASNRYLLGVWTALAWCTTVTATRPAPSSRAAMSMATQKRYINCALAASASRKGADQEGRDKQFYYHKEGFTHRDGVIALIESEGKPIPSLFFLFLWTKLLV